MSEENYRKEEGVKSPLLELIEGAGLTQKQVADALGVSPQSVNNWIHKRYKKEPVKLSVKQVKILCQVLGVSLDRIPDDFGPTE